MELRVEVKSSKPHVAIFNCAEHGHVNPTLGLIKALVARGYRVSYTTSTEFAPIISACGAIPIIYQPTFSKEKPRPEEMGHVVVELAKEATLTYDTLFNAFVNDRPDIIAYGPLSWLGKIFAALWGLPSIALNPTHVSYQGQSEEWLGITADAWPCLPLLNTLLRQKGVALDLPALLSRHDNVIAFIPRCFQEKAETVDPRVIFVGPEIVERPAEKKWVPAAQPRPVVVVSLGSVYTYQRDFFNTCIAAFADTEFHLILSIGRYVTPEELVPIAANIEVHAQIPQLEVLQTASLFITHAGMNSLMEAAHFGVPVIAVPQQAEQRLNARRLQQLGLGLHLLRETIDAAGLLAAARALHESEICRAQIAKFQQQLKAAGGASAAADLFDSVLAGKPLRHQAI